MIKKILIIVIFSLITTSVYSKTDYEKYIIKPYKRESWLQRFLNTFKGKAFDKGYAIIISVSNYEKLPPLPSTKRDAEKMKQYLISTGEYDEIVVLQDDEATFERIRYFMQSYFPEQMSREGNYRFLFYFTGHGTQHQGYRDKTIGYLQLKGATGKSYDSDTIGMNQIEQWSDKLRYAKHVLFLLDCCFSGLAGSEKKGGYDTRADPIELSRENGRHMITAGGADEISIADLKTWGGSLFTDVAITGMKGAADTNADGVVTIYELFVYANGAVKKEAKKAGYTQNPLISDLGMYKDKGQYFFVYKPVESVKETAYLDIKPEEKSSKEIVNYLGMKFIYIPPDTFKMGSPADEKGRDDDERQHQVTLTKGFYMQTTEVTVAQWRLFTKETKYKTEAEKGDGCFIWKDGSVKKEKGADWDNPGYGQTDEHPVTCVSWNDAQKFIDWLNKKGQDKYRLPTEAEWEYAARSGGKEEKFAGFSDEKELYKYGNFCDVNCKLDWKDENQNDGYAATAPVSSFKPNGVGLYDMSGNVWEWVQDWYGDYPSYSVTDPTGPEAGSGRVVRGGSWYSYARYCRSADRGINQPDYRDYVLGFRVCLLRS